MWSALAHTSRHPTPTVLILIRLLILISTRVNGEDASSRANTGKARCQVRRVLGLGRQFRFCSRSSVTVWRSKRGSSRLRLRPHCGFVKLAYEFSERLRLSETRFWVLSERKVTRHRKIKTRNQFSYLCERYL